jgi:hypothetical protein
MDYGTQQNEDIVVRILQKRPWNQDVQTDVFLDSLGIESGLLESNLSAVSNSFFKSLTLLN